MSVLTFLFIPGCTPQQEPLPQLEKKPAAAEQLTISYGGLLPPVLAIAADQGFFTREGLDVTIKDAILGKNAFEDMLAGKSDFAVLAETPLVIKSFQRNDFLIVSTLFSTNNLSKIALRRDRGITSVAALKGRRIATAKGTAPHYYLDLVLAKNSLTEKDIVPLFLESEKLGPALIDGTVDAIAAPGNVIQGALKKLGENGVLLENPGLCLNYSLLVTTKGYSADHPERISRLFRALQAADSFLQQQPDKSREIVMASLKLSRQEYDVVWSGYTNRLALDNALLLTLEEHARWALDTGLVPRKSTPNYLEYIAAAYLQKVAPMSVRLKR
ncbi:MAG: ABC transporter substrate-binding protein, partial [Geobacteraceae bacterium]|nr:ABC transporter substrate-binding protein [Geobacteraceae bacterium]